MRGFRTLFFLALTLVLLPNLAGAGENDKQTAGSKVIIVLDASGSMWGQLGGKPKIAIAREVIGGLLEDWDPGVDLGLTVYGHREKGNCADIESMVPVGKADTARVLKAIKDINPKGKTPLSAAVQKAAQELKYTEDQATVILVSDGKETCGQDPCAVGSALEKAGVNFTAHVVGFDVSQEEQAGLKCLAANTGGRFLSAKNAPELREALATAVEEVKAAVPPGLHLSAVYAEGKPVEASVGWAVYKAQAGIDGNRERVTYSYGSSAHYELPPGRYYVTASLGSASVAEELEIGDEGVRHVFNLGAGILNLSAIYGEGGDAVDKSVGWVVHETKTDIEGNRKRVTYSYNAKESYVLSAGKFLVTASLGSASVTEEVEISAGQATNKVFNLNAGILNLSSTYSKDGTFADKNVGWTVHETKTDMAGNRKRVTYSYNAKESYIISAGKFLVTASLGSASVTDEVEVFANQATNHVVNLNAGILNLSSVYSRGGDAVQGNVGWTVHEAKTDIEGNRKRVTYSYNAKESYVLPAGKFLVTSSFGSASATDEITIVAGQPTNHVINLNAGRVSLSGVNRGKPVAGNIGWTVYEAKKDMEGNRKRVTYSYNEKESYVLSAGRYLIQAGLGELGGQKEIEIKAGQSQTLAIPMK